ncbi:VOC family protein [Agarilytica rhodophyticola]|uniref:VOC family protein n=1 Tax=Agarilytica rhodophyticola TaxID=1737490 RepID=UPI001C1F5317|nr:VOC family protein [Agarilytica rhodophyticola]
MKDVGFVYKSSIVLACLILMIASVACTGWFFYSWLGGIPGIVGAFVGCAVQIMAYGFSGVVVKHVGGFLRLVLIFLITSALSLSILSSYATLNGYLSALQEDKLARDTIAEQKDRVRQAALNQRIQLLESMSRDVELGSQAADQGLTDKYRTQANKFLKSNAQTRTEIDAQLEKVESMIDSNLLEADAPQQRSPIDGLSAVLGGQSATIMIICIWLAIMFDALPIAGIALLEGNYKKLKPADSDEEETEASITPESDAINDPEHLLSAAFGEEPKAPVLLEMEASKEDTQAPEDESSTAEDSVRVITNICTSDLAASKSFYVELLDIDVKYDSDWYVQLCSPHDQKMEFGLIQRDHELIPNDYRQAPNGMYLTFVVPDVNATFERAIELGAEVIQEPRNEFYGQRRFLVREPSGCLVDVSSPWDQEEEESESQAQEYDEPEVREPLEA